MEKLDRASVGGFKDGGKNNDAFPLRGTRSRGLYWLPTSAAMSILISLTYLISRTKSVLLAGEAGLVVWAVLFIEIATAGMKTLRTIWFPAYRTDAKIVPRLFTQLSIFSTASKAEGDRLPQPIIDDEELPRVDIFVTYCGEGVDIVSDTLKASCAQDYPQSLVRVIVLDDSGSTELAEAISSLQQCSHPNLYYASRNVQVNTHSKAANLNFGTQFTNALPDGSADFLAVLDVDMIPEPHWLRTVLPHLLHCPKAGLACPFQRFYNIPPNDPLGMTHDIKTIESHIALQDHANETFCTGTGFVIRRNALDQIQGFPEDSLQEDILTSVALSARGWHTVYVRGSLQWGLAANSFADWIRQRQRWAAGILSISQYLCSARARKLPRAARISGALWGAVDGSASLFWTVSMVLLPPLVLSGRPLLPANNQKFLFHVALLDFVAQSMCQVLLSSLMGYRMALLAPVAAIYTAPYRLAITVRFYFLPKLLGNPLPRFTPTGINASLGKAEREARRKGWSCAKVILWDCGTWIYAVVLVTCLAGAAHSVDGALRASSSSAAAPSTSSVKISPEPVLQELVVRIAWPPLFFLWLLFAKSAWTPLAYAFAPPFVVRDQLLDRKEDTGAAYPKKGVKERHMEKSSQNFWLVVAAWYVIGFLIFGRFLWHQ